MSLRVSFFGEILKSDAAGYLTWTGPCVDPTKVTVCEGVCRPCYEFFFFKRYGPTRPNSARTRFTRGLCGSSQIDPDLNELHFKQPNPPFWWVEPSWHMDCNPF